MYERLQEAINSVKIVDHHCHVGIALAGEQQECPEAARLQFKDPFSLPKNSKTGGFTYLEELHYDAYEKLYGFTREMLDNPDCFDKMEKIYTDRRRNNACELVDQALEISGIDYVIGNIALPEVLKGHPKVSFTPRIDPMLYPFENDAFIALRNSIYPGTIRQFEWELAQLRKEVGLEEYPETFDGYLAFVDQVLAYFDQKGYHGYKIFSAYVRSTLFAFEAPETAQDDYEKAKLGDVECYQRFQNRVMWHMMEHAAQKGIPVQVHMALVSTWIDDTNPLNFLVFLQNKKTANLKLVILHGGYPRFYEAKVLALSAKSYTVNNVYLDMSGRIMQGRHPSVIADMLYDWLVNPDLWKKVLYGSDMLYGERFFYTCAQTGRKAVYLALKRLIDNEIVSEDGAIEIAKNILRNNAIRLYGLDLPLA